MIFENVLNLAIKEVPPTGARGRALCIAFFICSMLSAGTASGAPGAAGNSCSILFTQLWGDSLKNPIPRERRGYWSRAKAAVTATSSETLENIFAQFSKQELELLFWRIAVDDVKATTQEEIMVRELRHMVDDLGVDPFWKPVQDRGAAIRDAIIRYDQKLSNAHNLAFVMQSIDKSIGKTEVEILSRALSEQLKNETYRNSKSLDRVARYVFPYYPRVQSILLANAQIRSQLQFAAAIQAPVGQAIRRFMSSSSAEAQLQLQTIEAEALHRLENIRESIRTLYGRDVSPEHPFKVDDVRMRDLGRRAEAFEIRDHGPSLQAAAERNIDVLERHFNIRLSEKLDSHLQIRNEQLRRETQTRMDDYLAVTSKRSPQSAEYEVRTEWLVTVRHEERRERTWTRDMPDPEGRITRTETYHDSYTNESESKYPMHRRDLLRVNYEEVLHNAVAPSAHLEALPPLPQPEPRGAHAVSAVNEKPFFDSYDRRRVDAILGQGEAVRRSEEFFRRQIVETVSFADSLTNDVYKATLEKDEARALLARIEYEERHLLQVRERLSHYQALEASAIKAQWMNDVEKDFRDRNRALLDVYDHMLKRIANLAEQVRRQTPSLIVEASLPSYEAQLHHLKSVEDHNDRILKGTALGAALTGTAVLGYVYHPEIIDAIRYLTGAVAP